MDQLIIYDILVYHFKKNLAKVIYGFVYEIHSDQFAYKNKKFINNKLYYCFSYSGLNINIREINGKLFYYDEYFDEEISLETTITYDNYDNSTEVMYASDYEQYIHDVIENDKIKDY